MADPVWTALRVLHIGAGVALVGGATMWNLLLAPTFAQMGPTLPRGFTATVGGKVVRYLPHLGLVTFLTGVALYAVMQSFYDATWRWLMLAALVVMLANLGLSYGLMVPTFKKLGAAMAAAQGPPGPEVQRLLRSMKTYGLVGLGLAWGIVLLMVVATALRST